VGDLVDIIALAVLAVAVLRGLWIGLVREVFSIAALAAAILAFRAAHRSPLITGDLDHSSRRPRPVRVVIARLFVTIAGTIVRRLMVQWASVRSIASAAALSAAEGAGRRTRAARVPVLGPRDRWCRLARSRSSTRGPPGVARGARPRRAPRLL
jgi:hypothetical protein